GPPRLREAVAPLGDRLPLSRVGRAVAGGDAEADAPHETGEPLRRHVAVGVVRRVPDRILVRLELGTRREEGLELLARHDVALSHDVAARAGRLPRDV